MRRIAFAAMLAGIVLLGSSTAPAADPYCFAVKMFPSIHQHGPLFNYGPYYGYPPFEPYGYWNAYLQYTGPVPAPNYASGHPGAYGFIHGPNPHTFGAGFPHPLAGIGHGNGLLHHRGQSSGCSSCGAAAQQVVNSGNAIDRYNGVGQPASSLAFYADSPSIITVGFSGR